MATVNPRSVLIEWWHSDELLAIFSRVLLIFLLLWPSWYMGTWAYYQFAPRSAFFTYHDTVGVELESNGVLLVESYRTIRYSGLYEFNDRIQCLDRTGAWVGEGRQTTQAVMPAGPTLVPAGRWRFRASIGVFGDRGMVPLPATCRFINLVTVYLPRDVARSQVLTGSEFVIEEFGH